MYLNKKKTNIFFNVAPFNSAVDMSNNVTGTKPVLTLDNTGGVRTIGRYAWATTLPGFFRNPISIPN